MVERELLSHVQTLWPFISGIPVKYTPYFKVAKWISNVLVQTMEEERKCFKLQG
jgi:hypothetical protein